MLRCSWCELEVPVFRERWPLGQGRPGTLTRLGEERCQPEAPPGAVMGEVVFEA